MKENNKSTPQDERLLSKIEEILCDGEVKVREDHSLLGLCAELTNTVPEAKSKFREALWVKLVVKWQENQRVQIKNIPGVKKSEPETASWFQHIVPLPIRLSRLFKVKRGITMKRRVVLAILSMLIIVLLTMTFVPSVRAAVVYILSKIVLGPNTVAMQTYPSSERNPRTLPEDMWIIRTEIGNFAGNAPSGVKPIVRSVHELVDAQTLLDYQLKVPTELPVGYTLREVKLAPLGVTAWAILFYNGPGHEIIIAEMPGGPQPSKDPDVAIAVKTGLLTDGIIEEVNLDNKLAAWIDGNTLLWEENGVSFEVGGLDLNLQEAITIARSLH
jgi:hypothetical protein